MANTGPGRPRKPTAAHKRDGTYRPARHGGRNEPEFRRPDFQPPPELDKLAKKEWKRLAGELAALGLLTRADRATFAAYCQAWSDWIQLTDTLNKMGDVTYTTANGYVGITPLIHTRQKAWQMMKEAATRFGLDPSSRASLDVSPLPTDVETDEDFFYGTPTLEK
ncbi:MAG: phage terminase small subunit P27 family [Gemmatimonadetes bacterium]|nr:phage terminase small subunit P27 family [Gemmatimonadota bacterium]